MKSPTNWSDLMPRTLSALVLVAVGVIATYFGGTLFNVLILVACVAMLWELIRMMRVALSEGRDWPHFLAYSLAIVAASCVFIYLRGKPDGIWSISVLFGIVVLSDVFGYFAGKTLGGPKFWPRISPKKTWSGTIAGWAAAGAFGLFANCLNVPQDIVLVTSSSVLNAFIFMALAFAAQMGDIVESALKRRNNIKDSSNLIPGHGGVLDRFDGMVGVGFVLALFIVLYVGFGG